MPRGIPCQADWYLSWLALVPWPWRSCSSFLARSAQRDTRRLRTATNKHTRLADSVRSAPADDSTTCKASLQRAACNVDATRPEPAAQANGATCVHRSQRSQRPSKHGAIRHCGSCSQGNVHTACARICLYVYTTPRTSVDIHVLLGANTEELESHLLRQPLSVGAARCARLHSRRMRT